MQAISDLETMLMSATVVHAINARVEIHDDSVDIEIDGGQSGYISFKEESGSRMLYGTAKSLVTGVNERCVEELRKIGIGSQIVDADVECTSNKVIFGLPYDFNAVERAVNALYRGFKNGEKKEN